MTRLAETRTQRTAAYLLGACLLSACTTDRQASVADSALTTEISVEGQAISEPNSATTPSTTNVEPSIPPAIVVVDNTGVEVQIESIERIIPLDGDVAEVVFALGLGDNVVATDLSATFPPAADALPEIGYQRALSTEPILAFEPTVILATDLAGPDTVIADLRAVGVPVVIVPNNDGPGGPAEKIRAIAQALGMEEVGEALAAEVSASIDAAGVEAAELASEGSRSPRVVALYVRGSSAQLVMGEGTTIDWLIEHVGAINVADEMGVVDTEPISAEAMLAAAPDVIIVPKSGLDSVGGIDGLLQIDGLDRTPAGQQRAVIAYDDQLMLGNGPRTGDFLIQFIADLYTSDLANTLGDNS